MAKLKKGLSTALLKLINSGKKSPLPSDVFPMLATLVDKAFDESGWLYEVKWDGYRALSYLNSNEVNIRSRNNKSFNEKFYPIKAALSSIPLNIVMDGEVVLVDKKGQADFAGLQTWRSEADGELRYYVFDLIWIEGFDVTQLPLSDRRKILKSILPQHDLIKLSEAFETNGKEFFKVAHEMRLEGIIAKKETGVYRPGARSKDWLKIKTEKRDEAIIAGFTQNENSSRKISALLLGQYNGDELEFIGPVGTGFSNKMQDEILHKLKPLQIKKCPFKEVPEYNKPSRFRPNPPKAKVTWVKPELVAEVSYRTQAPDGSLRHPSFIGLREDKPASTVSREKETSTNKIIGKRNKSLSKSLFTSGGKTERKTLLNPKDESQVRMVGGHELKFSNLSKIYWPKEKITKRDMMNYYYQVAPVMLPYMKDRPQTLNRHPNGIEGESFYQKNVSDKVPNWIKTFPYHSERDGRDKEFLVCMDEASLLYIASLGCIEMNPWSSTMIKPDHPDWCVIDLDPDKNSFQQVIEAACTTKKILDSIEVDSFCKTSGSTGLHIYIPLGRKYTYEDSKEFARAIATKVHRELPKFTSIERLTNKRNGKMYIDFLQNRPQATLAAAYSLRPKPGAPVSMPLHWDEVKKGLRIQDFNILNAIARIKKEGDLFKGVLGKGINMKKALKKLD